MPRGVGGGGGGGAARNHGSGHSFWAPAEHMVHCSYTSIKKLKAGQATNDNQMIPAAAFEVKHFTEAVEEVLARFNGTEKRNTIDYFTKHHPAEADAPIVKLLERVCEPGFLRLRSIELAQLNILDRYESDAQRNALEDAKVAAFDRFRYKFYDVSADQYSEDGRRFVIGPEHSGDRPVYWRKPENKDWPTRIRFYFTIMTDETFGFNIDETMDQELCLCIAQEQRTQNRITTGSHNYSDRVICLSVGAMFNDDFTPQVLIPNHKLDDGKSRTEWKALPLPTTDESRKKFFNIGAMPNPPDPSPPRQAVGGAVQAAADGEQICHTTRPWLFKTGDGSEEEDGQPYLSIAPNRKGDPEWQKLANFKLLGFPTHVGFKDPEVTSSLIMSGLIANPATRHLDEWKDMSGCFHIPVNALGDARNPSHAQTRNYKYISFEVELKLADCVHDGKIRAAFAGKTGCPWVRLLLPMDGPKLHSLIEWYEQTNRAARQVTGITYLGRQSDNLTYVLANGAILDNSRWVPIDETDYYLLLSPLIGKDSILKVPYISEADLPRFFLLPSPAIMYAYLVNVHNTLKELFRDHRTNGAGRCAVAFQMMGAVMISLKASQIQMGNHGGSPVLHSYFINGPKDSGKSLLSGLMRALGGNAPSLRSTFTHPQAPCPAPCLPRRPLRPSSPRYANRSTPRCRHRQSSRAGLAPPCQSQHRSPRRQSQSEPPVRSPPWTSAQPLLRRAARRSGQSRS